MSSTNTEINLGLQASKLFPPLAVNTSTTGGILDASGIHGLLMCEIVEGNIGAASVVMEGSFDQVNWYVVGYQLVSNVQTPARAVAGFSVVQNTKQVLQILDYYPYLRARPNTNSGSLTVRYYVTGI